MNPIGVTIDVVRFFGQQIVERRTLPVTSIVHTGRAKSDWSVSLHWARGRGEVQFSIVKGYLLERGGHRQPWRLDPEGARALLALGEPLLGPCKLCHQPTWFAAVEAPDRLPPELRSCLGSPEPHA